jgi:hypothetical protein
VAVRGFTVKELAERWIGDHGLTGMLTEYPLDMGVYDWAVAKGFFRSGKPAHSSTGLSLGSLRPARTMPTSLTG